MIAERAAAFGFKVNIISGASVGVNVDRAFAAANAVERRTPFQQDPTLRHAINNGSVAFTDPHLGDLPRELLDGDLGDIDVAAIEAIANMPTAASCRRGRSTVLRRSLRWPDG